MDRTQFHATIQQAVNMLVQKGMNRNIAEQEVKAQCKIHWCASCGGTGVWGGSFTYARRCFKCGGTGGRRWEKNPVEFAQQICESDESFNNFLDRVQKKLDRRAQKVQKDKEQAELVKLEKEIEGFAKKDEFIRSMPDQDKAQKLEAAFKVFADDGFVSNINENLKKWGSLSDKQVDAVVKKYDEYLASKSIKQYNIGDHIDVLANVSDMIEEYHEFNGYGGWHQKCTFQTEDGLTIIIKTGADKKVKTIRHALENKKQVHIVGTVKWLPDGKKYPILVNGKGMKVEIVL